MKVKELLEASVALNKLMMLELDAKTAYRVSRNMKKAVSAINDAERERKKLIEKYFVRDEKGRVQPPTDIETKEKADKEWEEMIESEVDIDIHKVPLSWIAHAKMCAQDIRLLEPFLLDDMEEKK